MDGLTRRELVLGASALALGASDAFAMPARDPGWGVPVRVRRAGGARPRALRELARRVRGPVLGPGAVGYAAAARVYNARFDGVAPDAVIEPLDSDDVRAVLRWADRHDVRVGARSGGHSYAGYSTLDEGVVVDLRRLRSIDVIRDGRRARSPTATRPTRSSTSPTTPATARRAARGCAACTASSPRTRPAPTRTTWTRTSPAGAAPTTAATSTASRPSATGTTPTAASASPIRVKGVRPP